MSMKLHRIHQVISVLLCLVLGLNELHADVIPGRWEKVHSQAVGTKLTINLKTGEQIEAFFYTADSENIVVRDEQGEERKIRKIEIARVETAGAGSRRRAVLIGAVAGGVPMAGLGALLGRGFEGPASDMAKGAAILGALGAGIGALVGYAMGRGRKDTETLYVAYAADAGRK
jgi:hypothetical protein